MTTNELVMENSGLFYHIAKKHGPLGPDYDEDDIAQALFIEALRLAPEYDPDMGKWSAFIGSCMWNFLAKERRRYSQNRFYSTCGAPEIPIVSAVPYFRHLFAELRAMLVPKLQLILDLLLRFDGDRDLVAEASGLSPRTIRSRICEIRSSDPGRLIAAAF